MALAAIRERLPKFGGRSQGGGGTLPFAPFEWTIAGRYLRTRRKEGFVSVIALFSFLGIMLGVATLIIVLSVMNGFRKELLSKIVGINGHIFVAPIDRPDDGECQRRIDERPALGHCWPQESDP